eukprot:7454817-Pyramimonas_sp.AAC.1
MGMFRSWRPLSPFGFLGILRKSFRFCAIPADSAGILKLYYYYYYYYYHYHYCYYYDYFY